MSAAITFSGLEVRYGASVVLQDLDLIIEEGEFTCLLGPSGCGKSTMLRMVGELATPSGGTVDVLGRSPRQAWRDLAFVFQAPRLVPWRTALGNVLLGLQLRGVPGTKAELKERARRAMVTVGIEHLADRPAHVLSGGEQQRVSIARAIALEPKVLLMDEPFSALDVQTRRALRQEIVSLWRRTGLTIVFVTHDIDEALIVGSRLVVFSGKPTRVLAERPVTLAEPVTASTPGFTEAHDEIVALFGPDSAAVDELTDTN